MTRRQPSRRRSEVPHSLEKSTAGLEPGHAPKGSVAHPGNGDAREIEDRGKDLMLSFQRGDEKAFDALVAQFQLNVYRFLLRTLRDEGRSEDLTQEVFVRVYRSKNQYEPVASFRTWLFTIAHRLALNEIRALRRRRRVFAEPGLFKGKASSADASEECDGDAWQTASESENDRPEAALEGRELAGLLDAAIGRLPGNQRLAIELQRAEIFSYQEIADILGVSSMAVKSLLVRSRDALRLTVERYFEGSKNPMAGTHDDVE